MRKRLKQKAYIRKQIIICSFLFLSVQKHLELKKQEVQTDTTTSMQRNDAESILHVCAEKLNVKPEILRIRTYEGTTSAWFPINQYELDLNYSNYIISREMQKHGIRLIEGLEIHQAQKLHFSDNRDHSEIIVRLFYDDKKSYKRENPKLAIVVEDFGSVCDELVLKYTQLDKNICFAIIPGLRYSDDVMNMVEDSGHEIIIHAPMEPTDFPKRDPGKNAIFVDMSKGEIQRQIKKYLRQLPFAVGLSNHMGNLATADTDVMKSVLEVLKEENLYFIDNRASTASVGYQLAQQMLIPSYQRDLYIDLPDASNETLTHCLDELTKLRDRKQQIILVAHFKGIEEYECLKTLIRRVRGQRFDLVPVSNFGKKTIG